MSEIRCGNKPRKTHESYTLCFDSKINLRLGFSYIVTFLIEKMDVIIVIKIDFQHQNIRK